MKCFRRYIFRPENSCHFIINVLTQQTTWGLWCYPTFETQILLQAFDWTSFCLNSSWHVDTVAAHLSDAQPCDVSPLLLHIRLRSGGCGAIWLQRTRCNVPETRQRWSVPAGDGYPRHKGMDMANSIPQVVCGVWTLLVLRPPKTVAPRQAGVMLSCCLWQILTINTKCYSRNQDPTWQQVSVFYCSILVSMCEL